MIARSIQSSAFTSATRVSRKKSTKKPSINTGNSNVVTTTTTTTNTTYHKTPLFSCDCFYCYTAYWCRWDSSPNRELIHQAIEAFEDHLTNGEKPKKNTGRGKRRDRIGRQGSTDNKTLPVVHCPTSVNDECVDVPLSPVVEDEGSVVKEVEESGPVVEDVGGGEHQKGLATKVLPDVLGFFNSRLWSLWSPNL